MDPDGYTEALAHFDAIRAALDSLGWGEHADLDLDAHRDVFQSALAERLSTERDMTADALDAIGKDTRAASSSDSAPTAIPWRSNHSCTRLACRYRLRVMSSEPGREGQFRDPCAWRGDPRGRVERGYAQERFAAHAGIDRSYFGAVERGEFNITLANLLKIAAGLDVPAWTLLKRGEVSLKGVK